MSIYYNLLYRILTAYQVQSPTYTLWCLFIVTRCLLKARTLVCVHLIQDHESPVSVLVLGCIMLSAGALTLQCLSTTLEVTWAKWVGYICYILHGSTQIFFFWIIFWQRQTSNTKYQEEHFYMNALGLVVFCLLALFLPAKHQWPPPLASQNSYLKAL